MTQRIFRHPSTKQKVMTGWDRPLQYLFLVIENDPEPVDEDDEGIVWSNLAHPEVPLNTVDDIRTVLEQHGIPLPEAVEYGLEEDKAGNVGNLVRDHGTYPRTGIKAAVLEDGKWVRKDLIYVQGQANYKVFTEIVGGHIEGVPLPEPACDLVTLFCNENGKITDPPLLPTAIVVDENGKTWHILAGPLVAVGGTDEGGDSEDLTDQGFEALTRCIKIIPPGSGTQSPEYDTSWGVIGPLD